MIAVTFALPDESRNFVKVLRIRRRKGQGVGSWIEGTVGSVQVLVWHVGIGFQSARAETARLLAHAHPQLLLAAGYAGALQAGLEIGDIVLDRRSVASVGPLNLRPSMREGRILTRERAAESTVEKERLGLEHAALAVDMETAVIAEVCAFASIPVVGVRSISDRVQDALPVPMQHWFNLERQRPAVSALLYFLAAHPGKIAPFARFVRSLAPARRNLAEALCTLLPQLAASCEEPAARS